jgi:hypothetical protein
MTDRYSLQLTETEVQEHEEGENKEQNPEI